MPIKPVVWLGDSQERVRAFPVVARQRMGLELWEVQQGNTPTDSKPMGRVGAGVWELRVRAGGAYRLLYIATFAEAVYVLHGFEKRSRKTAHPDVALARARFRSLTQERKGR